MWGFEGDAMDPYSAKLFDGTECAVTAVDAKEFPARLRMALTYVKFIENRRKPIIAGVGGFQPQIDFAQPIPLSPREEAAYHAALSVITHYFWHNEVGNAEISPASTPDVLIARCPQCRTGALKQRMDQGEQHWVLACDGCDLIWRAEQ